MNKGKVVDIQNKYVIVLNDEMTYEKIKKKEGLSLGKEIYYFKEDLYKEAVQPVKKYFLVAAVFFMMLFIQPLLVAEEAYGYISVDINPSIELQVDKDLDVLSIEAINEDAKGYMKDEWIGKPAKEVINLIIEETKSKGVLNNERDFVLVSYYFNDEDPTSEEFFIQSLDKLFNEKPHDYEVAVIKSDAETYSEAKEAKESLGKHVVNKKMNTKVDDLLAAKVSIEEDEDFKIYKRDIGVVSDDVDDEREQKSTSKSVIGRKAAEGFAFDHIGGEGQVIDFNFENDDQKKYEFEILFNGKVYHIEMKASNGEVIDYKVDDLNDEKGKSKGVIGRKAAEDKAFDVIGGHGKVIDFDFDKDDDKAEYSFEIVFDGKIHEVEINGFTGELIEYEVDDEEINDADKKESQESSKGVIGKKAAENKAFDVIGGQGKVINFDFDKEDDKAEYSFEIVFDDKIHEVEINGFTGEIIEYEVDDEEINDADKKESQESSKGVIGKKAAENKAFDVIGGQGKVINFDFDKEDDKAEYSFEIVFDDKIHEVEINGFTGEIIEYEVDDEEIDDADKKESQESSKGVIGKKAAENKAFDVIGGQGKVINFDFDKEDDKAEYSFEIVFDGKIHEVEINGFTGEVIEYEVDDER